jgi:hypothetical protein
MLKTVLMAHPVAFAASVKDLAIAIGSVTFLVRQFRL